jgi:hypothetical protein
VALTTVWCIFIRCDHDISFPPSFSTLSSISRNAQHHQHHGEASNTVEVTKPSHASGIHDGDWASTGFPPQSQVSSQTVEVQEVETAEQRKLLRGSNTNEGEKEAPSSLHVDAAARMASFQQRRRKLPGYADRLGAQGTGGIILLVIVVLILLFCCRGMLCDILACVCLYEICCGDGAVGGFELM